MAVPQERTYANVLEFPAALPLDRGTWSDFSRHLFHHVIALDCTLYTEWVSGPAPPKSRLKEYLKDLPHVKTITAWMGTCGCVQSSWFLDPGDDVPLVHYTFSLSFTAQLSRLRAEGLRSKKLDSTELFNIAEILAANELRGVN